MNSLTHFEKDDEVLSMRGAHLPAFRVRSRGEVCGLQGCSVRGMGAAEDTPGVFEPLAEAAYLGRGRSVTKQHEKYGSSLWGNIS